MACCSSDPPISKALYRTATDRLQTCGFDCPLLGLQFRDSSFELGDATSEGFRRLSDFANEMLFGDWNHPFTDCGDELLVSSAVRLRSAERALLQLLADLRFEALLGGVHRPYPPPSSSYSPQHPILSLRTRSTA